MYETVQEIYEAQRKYFSRPGAMLAKDEQGRCEYRIGGNPNGCGCAVGCLIPDDLYLGRYEDYENNSVEIIFDMLVEDKIVPDESGIAYWLEATQYLHDRESKDAEDFVRGLNYYAGKYGLKVVTT